MGWVITDPAFPAKLVHSDRLQCRQMMSLYNSCVPFSERTITIKLAWSQVKHFMFRYRLAELIAEKRFVEGKVVTITEIGEATGISRRILSAIFNNKREANPTAETLEKLCRYFGCRVEQLVEFVADHPTDSENVDSGDAAEGLR